MAVSPEAIMFLQILLSVAAGIAFMLTMMGEA
jgi:hypothetical protein